MRHTSSDVFPELAIAASASPDFSDSLFGVARARSRKISSMETAVMDSSPGLYRCATPNLAHFLRASIAFVTFFVAVCTRVFFVVLICWNRTERERPRRDVFGQFSLKKIRPGTMPIRDEIISPRRSRLV